MLFYTQIRREFTHASWKRGQIYFRENRVHGVRLDGEMVLGRVKGTERKPYETAIVMARGTIFNSKCSCPAHRLYETHCKHVAALAIWVVERGSLLRAGIAGDGELGAAHQTSPRAEEGELILRNPQRAASDSRLRKLLISHPLIARSHYAVRRDLMAGSIEGRDPSGHVFSIPITLVEAAALLEHSQSATANKPRGDVVPGEGILFVRGSFQGKTLTAITVESGIRYMDPQSKTTQINTLTYLTKQRDPGIWKTTQGLFLYVPPIETMGDKEVNFIQRLDTNKVIFQGQAALEELAKLLEHKLREYIAFDPSVNVRVDTVPLRLVSLKLGEKVDKTRKLSFLFRGDSVELTSEELQELAGLGRLSNQYVWKADKIYKFAVSLTKLQQYANRTGVAAPEDESVDQEGGPKASPFGSVYDAGDHPLHPLAAYRLSLELGVEDFQVDSQWGEFQDWRKSFERKRLPALPVVEYGYDLREYQQNGLGWLWSLYHRGLSALLADDMGLGKTHQMLAFFSSIYGISRGKVKVPSLVVAPTSVIAAWLQKLNKYETGLKWHIFHGAGRKLPKTGVDVVLTTYGILHREPGLREIEWHTVVLDEAQAIKNANTISSRAARALKCRFRVAMTGTPVENSSSDLWSLMEFLLPGYLGSLPRFKRIYGWGREVPSEIEAQALRRLISPFLLRRTKRQVLKELPEKIEEVIQCEMTEVQKHAYRDTLNGKDAVKAREDLKKGGKVDYANILALLTRLKQICDHPKLPYISAGRKTAKVIDPAETGKWDAFEELVNQALGSNLKIVVFTQYLGVMEIIGTWLTKQGVGYTELRGDTPDRGKRLDLFAADPECKVFVCSLLAGGLGIDLTSASVCVHFDRWWNPAKENQATDRLHRLGQTRGVQVFKLQTTNTVEDRIASIIQTKTELSDALIESSAVGLKAFSRKDLLELLTFKE